MTTRKKPLIKISNPKKPLMPKPEVLFTYNTPSGGKGGINQFQALESKFGGVMRGVSPLYYNLSYIENISKPTSWIAAKNS